MSEFDIDLHACRQRQGRVLNWMDRNQIELVIVNQIVHVQYLVGPRFREVFAPLAALRNDGHLTLVAPRHAPDFAAADDMRTYESNWLSTLRNDQSQASAKVLLDALGSNQNARRVGCEFSSFPLHLSAALNSEFVDVEPELYCLRRKKDPDEMARIRMAIAGTAAMHRRAREIVQPGINEIDVFDELQAAANRVFGEVMTGTGNDYASGQRGGPPRNRQIEAGELYILDLGPAFRGYFADNTRTLAVGTVPTKEQQDAWQLCADVFQIVESTVRPGRRCQELFDEVAAHLGRSSTARFDHHLGHGIGLFPHEAPHLNPNWDDVFQAGEVIAVEPGLYADQLRAGIRLENNYLVTEQGVELLSDFPLSL